MTRVLVVGAWPPSLVNFRGELIKAMSARGHKVIACAGGEDPKVAAFLRACDAEYVSLPISRSGLNPLLDALLLWRLARLIRDRRISVVLAYTVKPVVYGMLAARATGISRRHALITGLGYVFISSSSWRNRAVGLVVRCLYRLALNGCSTVFFQNHEDSSLFWDQGLLSREVPTQRLMGSGVDLTRFSPAPLPSGVPVFLLVARLLGDKGIREFVAAARYLRGRYPIARCALLGPFDENPTAISRDELDEWVREDVVEYWGQTDDVRPFLAACTVFVMPSYREGMPRSVLEAMAMGRPIISTDVPGCRDTVEPGLNGWLVPARDATALANAMVHCIENLDLLVSMGLESRRLAEKNFDVHAINAIILKRLAL